MYRISCILVHENTYTKIHTYTEHVTRSTQHTARSTQHEAHSTQHGSMLIHTSTYRSCVCMITYIVFNGKVEICSIREFSSVLRAACSVQVWIKQWEFTHLTRVGNIDIRISIYWNTEIVFSDFWIPKYWNSSKANFDIILKYQNSSQANFDIIPKYRNSSKANFSIIPNTEIQAKPISVFPK